jgi:hypothetical protein
MLLQVRCFLPTVQISRSNPEVEDTNRPQVIFLVVFNEPVLDVDVSDFILSSGSISATVNGVVATSSTSYRVTIGGYNIDGLINLDFAPSQNIRDVAGNAFSGNITSEASFTINASLAPTLVIQRSVPSVELVNRSNVVFNLTFSENVSNVDISDFELSSSNSGGNITEVTTQTSSNYLLTVSGLSSNGLIDLNVLSGSNIETAVGHVFTGIVTTEETYTFDATAGPAASIARETPTDEVTNLAEVSFKIVFTAPVGNVDLSDFGVSANSVGATFGSITAVSSTDYLVNLIEIEDDGLLEIIILPDNNITDANGNRFNGILSTNQTYTILNLVTSIDDPFLEDLAIQLLENPSSGVFEVAFSKEIQKAFEFHVINLKGEVLLSGQRPFYNINDKIEVDLSSFTDGLYIFKLAIGNGIITSKLLKENK